MMNASEDKIHVSEIEKGMIILIGSNIYEVVDFYIMAKRSKTMHIIGLTVDGKKRDAISKNGYIELPSTAQLEALKEWSEKNAIEKNDCEQCSEAR